jgi:hypothetical protein
MLKGPGKRATDRLRAARTGESANNQLPMKSVSLFAIFLRLSD